MKLGAYEVITPSELAAPPDDALVGPVCARGNGVIVELVVGRGPWMLQWLVELLGRLDAWRAFPAVVDRGSHGGLHWLALTHVPRVRLATLLARAPAGLALPLAVSVVVDLARALAAGHAGGDCYRTLSPEDASLTFDGVGVLEVMQARRSVAPAGTARLQRTLPYLSPEQVRGDPITPSADVFALGALTFALLAGAPPFRATSDFQLVQMIMDAQARSLRTLQPELPAPLHALVEQMLVREPATRPTAAVVAERMLEAVPWARWSRAQIVDELRALAPREMEASALLLSTVTAPA